MCFLKYFYDIFLEVFLILHGFEDLPHNKIKFIGKTLCTMLSYDILLAFIETWHQKQILIKT